MTRKELVERLHEQSDVPLSKASLSALVDLIFDQVGDALAEGGRFSLPGFGTFTVVVRNARPGINPRTGETIQIAEAKSVRFKPAAALKDKVNP